MRPSNRLLTLLAAAVATLAVSHGTRAADDLNLTLRDRVETADGSGRYHTLTRGEAWKPEQTAIIVCDMWDLHGCLNAARREGEFAPRLEQVLQTARDQGVTIIHAPSACMEFYESHPARQRAQAAPRADNLPEQISEWCRHIPEEDRGTYPVDQSEGGCDDDPNEHAEWAAKLKSMGRDPRRPWNRQIDVLTIDAGRDYISDRGEEVWNILEDRGIDNVILTGVHTNMCVLGRPFGLRRMAAGGKHVVLMRDMTDTMYDPRAWPYVSHFTGTDLIVAHIEKFVCPTITSDQFLGGEPFVFKNDKRPHVVMLIGEDEYLTEQSLPMFAAVHLGKDYRVSFVFADESDRNNFPGIEQIADADVLLVSVRRRTLPPEQLDYVRRHVEAAKPLIGVRTASHAFTLRNQPPPAGLAAWPEFDAQVLGGRYTNHHGNKLQATISIIPEHSDHPLLTGVPTEDFPSGGSLYKTAPVNNNATILLTGTVEGAAPEPVAWIFTRADGGRTFYTSLGHADDFENPAFARMLQNAIAWAAGTSAGEQTDTDISQSDPRRGWTPITIPERDRPIDQHEGLARIQDAANAEPSRFVTLDDLFERADSIDPDDEPLVEPEWFRCFIAVSDNHRQVLDVGAAIECPNWARGFDAWWNGTKAGRCESLLMIPEKQIGEGLHTLALRIKTRHAREAFYSAGVDFVLWDIDTNPFTEYRTPLSGTWQHRIGDDPTWSNVPLPPKFAAPPDGIFEVK